MARARSGGSPSAAWALTLLGAGFFIFGILAVLFYTQKGGLEEQLESTRTDLESYVSRAEQNSPAVQEAKSADARTATGQQTVVGVLMARADQARNALVAANQQLDDTRVALENTQNQLEISQQALQEAQANAAAAVAGEQEARTTFQNQAADLTAKVAAAQQTNEQLQQDLDSMEALLSNDMREARAQMQQTIDELRVANDEADRQLAAALSRIAELTADRGIGLAKITNPDARIVSITEQGNQTHVYLDIGRNQKLAKGMTFSVFGPDQLIKLEDDAELEPKAVIEVFALADNSATARVVQRQRGRRVEVGDAAVNIAFDPNRVFRFFVFGDFDIGDTGTPKAADRDRITSRIRAWDSEVAEDIDYDVDYLVLGKAPELPRELTGSERSDPIRIQEYNAALRKYNTYTDLLNQAQEYNIPVLNQNRFLDLIGYYER